MTTLLNTYNGTTTQLRKLGIDVSGLTKEELAQGAAIDTVISKLQVYSEQLAQVDTRQHLTNIKNSWGDIKQSIGDLVNFSFAPLIARFDNALSSFRDKFGTFIQNVKITLANFPEFISKLGETIKSMLGKLFNFENIKNLFSFIRDYVVTHFKNTLTNMTNMLELILNAIPDTIKAIADGDEVGFDISELVNKVGNWLLDSPVGKIIDKIISTIVNGLPHITPHVCRHTFCTNMAGAGMDPKVLQYIMGHSEIEVTMNVYTHMNYERASAQMFELVDGVPEPKKAGPAWAWA